MHKFKTKLKLFILAYLINKIYFSSHNNESEAAICYQVICISFFNFRHLNAKHLLYMCSLNFLGFYVIKNSPTRLRIHMCETESQSFCLVFHQFQNSLFTRLQKKTSVGISLQSILIEKQCVWSYFLSPVNKSSFHSLGQVMNS